MPQNKDQNSREENTSMPVAAQEANKEELNADQSKGGSVSGVAEETAVQEKPGNQPEATLTELEPAVQKTDAELKAGNADDFADDGVEDSKKEHGIGKSAKAVPEKADGQDTMPANEKNAGAEGDALAPKEAAPAEETAPKAGGQQTLAEPGGQLAQRKGRRAKRRQARQAQKRPPLVATPKPQPPVLDDASVPAQEAEKQPQAEMQTMQKLSAGAAKGQTPSAIEPPVKTASSLPKTDQLPGDKTEEIPLEELLAEMAGATVAAGDTVQLDALKENAAGKAGDADHVDTLRSEDTQILGERTLRPKGDAGQRKESSPAATPGEDDASMGKKAFVLPENPYVKGGAQAPQEPPQSPALGAGAEAEAEGPAVQAEPTVMRPAVEKPQAFQRSAGDRRGDTRRMPPLRTKQPQPKGKRRKRRKKPSVFKLIVFNIMKTLFCVFCLVLIVGCIAAVGISQYAVASTANDNDVLDLESIKLNMTSYITVPNPDNPNAEAEGDYVKYQELTGPEHRIWVSLDRIPQDLKDAVITIEDKEFESHHGIDFKRTIAATINQIIPLQASDFGASTIDQQLVKNLTGDDDVKDEEDGSMLPGYQRKLREMVRAWNLNNRYSKDMILEAYLNTISLSGTIGGVQAGAQDYFAKNVWELDLAESAMIAGITRAPGYYDPYLHPDNCLKRRNDVLYLMWQDEVISYELYQEAVNAPLGLVEKKESEVTGEALDSTFSYFSDTVFLDVVEDLMEQKGMTRGEAQNYIYTQGLEIQATVDLNIQHILEEKYTHGYDDTEEAFFTNLKDPRSGMMYKDRLVVEEEELDENGNVAGTKEVLPQSAMTIIDYSGAVRGIVGGIGEKEGDLELNRAFQSPRQVGSTMKPIAAYALGIDNGLIDYSTMIEDSPALPRNTARRGSNAVNDWPSNFSKTYRKTGMPVVSAIAESTNTVAVKVGMRVGVEPMFEFLRDTLEITSLVGSEESPNDVDYAPLVLGSLTHGITTTELAGAYQMFGNAGQFNSVHTYTQVLDSSGNIVLQPARTSVQAISPEAAYVMNRMLYTVLHTGTAPGVSSTANRMAPEGEMDAVAKTGTTSDDKDRWFVGLTPYYVTAVWWGYDNNHELRWSPLATGNPPPLLWKSVMEEVQAELEYKEFPEKPDGVEEAAYCTISGERAGPGCPSRPGYFIPEIRPTTICWGHGGGGEEAPAEG